MIATRSRIGALITTIQEAFLETPGLVLTVPAAITRFAIDTVTCEALLNVLVDAGVLTRTTGGAYARYFPPRRRRPRPSRRASQAA